MAQLHVIPLYTFDGADSDYHYWHCDSYSRPYSGIEHVQMVDKRNGWATCSCEDASYRHKIAHILEPGAPGGCKHLRDLIPSAYQRQGLTLHINPNYANEKSAVNIGLAA